MIKNVFTLLLLFFFSCISFGQNQLFNSKKLNVQSNTLDEIFYNYEVYNFDKSKLSDFLRANPNQANFEIEIGGFHAKMSLYAHDVRHPDYVHKVMTENGIIEMPRTENITYRGLTYDGKTVRLTVNDEMITGFIDLGDDMVWIESMLYLDRSKNEELTVVYHSKDVRPSPDRKCAFDEKVHREREIHDDHAHEAEEAQKAGLCWLFEMAIASDWQMVQKHGSVGATESRNTSTLNDVQPLWNQGQFEDDIEFLEVTQWTSSCASCDPWTTSTDAGTLLRSFTNWASGGGFGTGHDIGCLWTGRGLNGGTIGIAWVGATCTSNGYHVCEDYGGGSVQIRNLWAHEIGHNFDANHTSGFWIMAPSVNTSGDWATQSINEIDAYVDIWENSGCPDQCGPGPEPPLAFFEAEPLEGCVPFEVEFTDLSTGTVTEWEWEFPGGNPNASTDQNPVVTYDAPGRYDVILTARGPAGEDTYEEYEYIVAKDEPVASFTYTADQREFEFLSTSTGEPEFYTWDFGDGNQAFYEDPIHLYADDGEYDVTLTVENDCGVSTYTETVEVISEVTADFTSDVQSGCADLEVNFEDLSSSNVETWEWEFDGGSPAFSTDQYPNVLYSTPGVYGVTLTVFSKLGRYDDVKIDTTFIEVLGPPQPNFTSMEDSLDSRTHHFTNLTVGGSTYLWDFGDNTTSTEVSPSHTFPGEGYYYVELAATNSCGTEYFGMDVIVSSKPVARFSSDPDTACVGIPVQYMDNSLGSITDLLWEFDGGNPATSTLDNPVVTYNSPGVYDVTLYATNINGTDTLVSVDYKVVIEGATSDFDQALLSEAMYQFTDLSTNSDSVHYDFGDGEMSNMDNPIHTYANEGTYTVTQTAFSVCGEITSTQTLLVVKKAVGSFSSEDTTGCVDLFVQYIDATTGTVDMYEWFFEGGIPQTSSDQSPIVEYKQRGLWDVRLIVTNSAGSDTVDLVEYIDARDIPVSNFGYIQDSLNFMFSDSSLHYVDSVKYFFGDGQLSRDRDPMHSYDDAGSYDVTLVAYNNCGTDTSMQTVFIGGAEPLALLSADKSVICVGDTVFYMDESIGNPDTWVWAFEGGTPDSAFIQNPYSVYNTPGIFDVFMSATNPFGSSNTTLVDYIVVLGPLQANPVYNSNGTTVVFNSNFTGLTDSIHWDFGNGDFSNELNPTYDFDSEGMYSVTLTLWNACGEYTFTIDVNITETSIVEFGESLLKVYPNPAKDLVTIELEGADFNSTTKFVLTDLLGRTTENISRSQISSRKYQLDVSDLATGTYIVRVENDGVSAYTKMIISK